MTVITLSREIEAWAEAEVAAGKAGSVTEVALRALKEQAQWAALRRSCEEAEAEAKRGGWLSHEDVFDEIRARFADVDETDEAREANIHRTCST